MLKCLLWFLIGSFVGCAIGIGIVCMARSAGHADREGNKWDD